MSQPNRERFSLAWIAVMHFLVAVFLWLPPLSMAPAFGAENIDECGPAELGMYRALAYASERAYDDSQTGLERTPSGCVALVQEDVRGNLVIAFRGSMLGDRSPKHPFANLGGANIRRLYRDWAATNLKQTAGFLPRQYIEAAALVEKYVGRHPVDKPVYITGHSKGGGAATYAYVAACISPNISREQAERMRCVTFNAAVVREQNWRRLFRQRERERERERAVAAIAEPAADSICALVMEDDPVSGLAASEERSYVKRVEITPLTELTPYEQHGIRAVIDELEKRSE